MTQRTVAFKRIVDPDDINPGNPSNYIDIPIVASLQVIDGENAQLMIKTFYNESANDSRKTWTATVNNKSTPDGSTIIEDDSLLVDCERVSSITFVDTFWTVKQFFFNADPAPLPPVIDPSYKDAVGHYKSHVVRYNMDNVNDPNSTPWVDVEVIDVFRQVGLRREREATGAGQIAYITLNNDQGDKTFNDPSDPYQPRWADRDYWKTQQGWDFAGIILNDSNGNPDPVRLDPFTSIVNINWGGLAVIFGPQAEDAPQG